MRNSETVKTVTYFLLHFTFETKDLKKWLQQQLATPKNKLQVCLCINDFTISQFSCLLCCPSLQDFGENIVPFSRCLSCCSTAYTSRFTTDPNRGGFGACKQQATESSHMLTFACSRVYINGRTRTYQCLLEEVQLFWQTEVLLGHSLQVSLLWQLLQVQHPFQPVINHAETNIELAREITALHRVSNTFLRTSSRFI